jgi:hypothetical protein
LADYILIEDLPPYDGRYEFDFAYFTNYEWHKIRQLADCLPLDFWDRLEKADAGLVVAVTAICFDRLGKRYDIETFWRAEAGKIRLFDKEPDASPPAETPSDSGESESGNGSPSGQPGKDAGESPPPNDPSATGDRTLASASATSEN